MKQLCCSSYIRLFSSYITLCRSSFTLWPWHIWQFLYIFLFSHWCTTGGRPRGWWPRGWWPRGWRRAGSSSTPQLSFGSCHLETKKSITNWQIQQIKNLLSSIYYIYGVVMSKIQEKLLQYQLFVSFCVKGPRSKCRNTNLLCLVVPNPLCLKHFNSGLSFLCGIQLDGPKLFYQPVEIE